MRILIATNGSPPSDLAVRLGAYIQQETKAEAILLTVVHRQQERKKASAILSTAESLLRSLGAKAEKKIRVGVAASEILQEARKGNYDLIVIGDHAKGGFHLPLMAPTTEKVIAKKPCPVLIARGDSDPLRRVLLCEAGRDPSLLQRLRVRSPILLESFEELTVLHVMSQIPASPGVEDWELEADADELIERHTPEGKLLEEDMNLLQHTSLKPGAKVRHGLVVESILEEAKGGDYSLVVIGAHQSEGWERYFLDDLAHEIVRKLDRPVLVV